MFQRSISYRSNFSFRPAGIKTDGKAGWYTYLISGLMELNKYRDDFRRNCLYK